MALRLRGATSGYIELKAPASAGDNTLTLPTNNGGANQLLKIDGSGNLSWQSNLTFDGSTLTVTGGIGISTALFHIGDDDTKIDFTDNQIDLRTGGISRIYINNYALYVRTGFPLAFLATSGDSPNIKSGGTNAQDLLLTTGSGNPTRLQIGVGGDVTVNDGNLIIGTGGKGIDFSATGDGSGTDSSELLDDYEEGTWLPIFTDDGTSGNSASSYAIRLGWYTKIGNLVNLQMRLSNIVFSSFNSTHATYIKNVPYVIQGSTDRLTTGSALLSNCNLDSDTMTVGVFANTSNGDHSYFRFVQTKDNTAWAAVTIDQWTSGDNEILINFSYRTG